MLEQGRGPRRTLRLVVAGPFGTLSLLLTPIAAIGAGSTPAPVQTVLAGSLDGARSRVGDAVLLRVATPWSEAGCTLQPGGLVTGRIVALSRHSKQSRDGAVAIAFRSADCNGRPETPLALQLAALIGVAKSPFAGDGDGLAEAPPLAAVPGLGIGGSSGGSGTSGLRSVLDASDRNFTGSRSGDQAAWKAGVKLPARILPGDVIAIPRHRLGVGKGLDGATAIWGDGRDVKLERGTVLLLVASSAREAETDRTPATSATGGSAASVEPRPAVSGNTVTAAADTTTTAPPEPPDETEICSGVCTVVARADLAGDPAAHRVAASLPIHALGFQPNEHHRAATFDRETTLTYLDAHHLLCTFDPHHLRQRTGRDEETVRTVRAVLINPATHLPGRVMDWRVRGDEQYLWRIPEGRVLVHMGHELRLLDAGLQPLRSIPVEGRLAWVAVSPLGDHFAVGTVREMHSPAEHTQLEETLATEPEEMVDVRVFNAALHELFHTERSSRSPVPVLAEGGELRVHAAGANRWTIAQYGWNQVEQTVATAKSLCPPTLSTPERGLIFAVGCTATGGRWYRMLRADGHPLLKGESPSDEIKQTARASQAGVFAVRVIKAVRPMNYRQPFARADLLREELAVYRSSDGGGVEAIATEDFAPSEEAFAISPEGGEIALVGRTAIQFYSVRH